MKVSLVKKITAAILAFTMMTTSVAFASDFANGPSTNNVDNQSQLSAFQNVEACSVSVDEMNQVSGEFLGGIIVTICQLLRICKPKPPCTMFPCPRPVPNPFPCTVRPCKPFP